MEFTRGIWSRLEQTETKLQGTGVDGRHMAKGYDQVALRVTNYRWRQKDAASSPDADGWQQHDRAQRRV